MIIDAHTHLFPEDVRKHRLAFCRRDEGFRVIYGSEKARLSSPEEILESMDRDGVDRSVVCGFPWRDPDLCREGNDYLLDSLHRHGDRMIPFACLPLTSFRRAEKELERCLSQGARGVGELAFYSGDFSPGIVRRLASLLSRLSHESIPVLLHTNEPVGHDYPGKTLRSLQPIYDFLRLVPDVRVILAHWGGGFFFYELMPEVAQAAREVFYDTAASPFLYRPEIYLSALKIIGPDRILFGSDFPLLRPVRYFREMEEVGVPARVRRKIQGLNARSLLGPR